MGKKRIAQKTKEELTSEKEKLDQALKKGVKTKKERITEGRIYISSSYNNTVITLTDTRGNVLAWASAGNIGFKGTANLIPVILNGESQAALKVTAKWKKPEVDVKK